MFVDIVGSTERAVASATAFVLNGTDPSITSGC
jgi:hypothetical protein